MNIMPVELQFDIQTTSKELAHFMLYHHYHSMQGILGLVISFGALVLLIVRRKTAEPFQILLLIVLALAFTVFSPIILKYKAAAQAKRNTSFAKPIAYRLHDEGIAMTQGEEQVDLEWRNIFKVVDTGKCLVLYLSTVRALIWPKEQLGTQLKDVTAMLKEKVPAGRVRIKN